MAGVSVQPSQIFYTWFLSTVVDTSLSTGVDSIPMATKKHERSMSQQERAFWRDVLVSLIQSRFVINGTDTEQLMELADKFVDGLRARTTWRDHGHRE